MYSNKESWIETLIELLNEYGKEKWSPFDEWGFDSKNELFCKWLSSWYSEVMIISKKFWFIQWLVDNDKIDYKKLYDDVSDYCEDLVPYPAYDCLLMLLSISDTPIDDLILYLK